MALSGSPASEVVSMESEALPVGGPYFEDLQVGPFPGVAPAVTLTDGLAAMHQAIVGERTRLALDAELSRRVAGGVLASPALVWDVAIGQSTLITQRVIANLFYRGFMFRRLPFIGDTLYTTTEIVALKQNRPREGRAATGLAVIRVRTVDQRGPDRPRVLPLRDGCRCATLKVWTGQDADLDSIPSDLDREVFAARSRDGVWRSFAAPYRGIILPAWFPKRLGDCRRRCGIFGAGTRAADAEYRDGPS